MAVVPNGERVVSFEGRSYKFIRVFYSGSSTSIYTDQSAVSASIVEPASGGPAVTLGASTGGGNSSPTPNYAKEVTLAAGATTGPQGSVTIVVAYGTSVGSSK